MTDYIEKSLAGRERQMEVMIPGDFAFNNATSSPQVTAPKRFGVCYFSAPPSPSRLSQYYRDHFDESDGGVASMLPFHSEDRPAIPKSPPVNIGDHDFAFDVMSHDWGIESLSAEDLFDGGVIKPLKPPPPVGTRKIISPQQKTKGRDPFAVAVKAAPRRRGRESGVDLSKTSSRRAARSLSPLRHNQLPWEEEEEQPHDARNFSAQSSASAKGQKKWRLKDFFLFRSASEGRAADKDPLKKYTAAAFRRTSFSAIESPGSRRRGPVSAHELHYTVNRAVSEDLKKRTFLPYKQGILGRLAFNPAAHALANGFGFARK